MNLDNMTLGELKEINNLFSCKNNNNEIKKGKIDNFLIGKKVIVRTDSAGVHFGEIIEKEKSEVIIKNSRRLWYWKTQNNGISLSEIANHGVHKDSKICEKINFIWLDGIEFIVCERDCFLVTIKINEFF